MEYTPALAEFHSKMSDALLVTTKRAVKLQEHQDALLWALKDMTVVVETLVAPMPNSSLSARIRGARVAIRRAEEAK